MKWKQNIKTEQENEQHLRTIQKKTTKASTGGTAANRRESFSSQTGKDNPPAHRGL